MHKYLTTGIASFGADMLLGLSKEQAAARSFALVREKDGYRPTEIVQFKAGETISVDQPYESLPGTLRSVLDPIGGKAGKAKPKAADKENKGAGAAAGDGSGE